MEGIQWHGALRGSQVAEWLPAERVVLRSSLGRGPLFFPLLGQAYNMIYLRRTDAGMSSRIYENQNKSLKKRTRDRERTECFSVEKQKEKSLNA